MGRLGSKERLTVHHAFLSWKQLVFSWIPSVLALHTKFSGGWSLLMDAVDYLPAQSSATEYTCSKGCQGATTCPSKVCTVSQEAVFMTHHKHMLRI